MLRLLIVPLLTLIFSTSGLASTEAYPDHSIWQQLLQKHVSSFNHGSTTQVNYRGFLTDKAQLASYLKQLESVTQNEFDRWNNSDQLAFLINAYNAWTVELILSRYPDLSSIKDLSSFFSSPWKKRFISLLGRVLTLDEIEHQLIRGSGRYNEPRIHFAVNCASIGCPALAIEAYTGEKIEQQLQQATERFLSDASRNRFVDDELQVSSIFKWYEDDFQKNWRGTNTLSAFLARYSAQLKATPEQLQALQQEETEISFLSYDWRLNDVQSKRQK